MILYRECGLPILNLLLNNQIMKYSDPTLKNWYQSHINVTKKGSRMAALEHVL